MAYGLAKVFGKAGMLILLTAPIYYLLRTVLVKGPKSFAGEWITQYKTFISRAMNAARKWHVSLTMIAVLLAAFHGYYMFVVRGVDRATLSGGLALLALVGMTVLGWIIHSRPQKLSIRLWHRRGMYAVLFLVAMHRLLE